MSERAGERRLGILTVSDGVSAGERDDRSGDLIAAWAEERGWEVAARLVVADERTAITRRLLELAVRSSRRVCTCN